MTSGVVRAAPVGLHLRMAELADRQRAFYVGGRRVRQNDQLLVQLVQRMEYVVRPGEGRNVCTEAKWVAVRARFLPVGEVRLPPRAAVLGHQVLVFALPVRSGEGAAQFVATTHMHLAWPGPRVGP